MSHTPVPTRPLGRTGFEITTLGFGSWVVAGGGWRFSWGATDDTESVAALRHAVEAGVNWIDTAAVYGLGHAEELVGKAVAGLPAADRPLIF
ncbi:aldo/keto reductase, partial [Nocardia thailandica]|uniref:aldo/keto reductase n=1 Tax=Nocardia thailandica TaxID=257275 RepID=UPI0005BD43EB